MVASVLGLIYDVHGNLGALEAVLADAGEAGIGRFLLGGDYGLFGPQPAQTVERLRSLDAQMIRGNVDRWTAHPHEAPEDPVVQGAIEECHAQLGDRTVADLDVLPEWLTDQGRVRFCHASPISDVRSFMPRPSDEDEELLGGHSEPLIVFGHTHLPFERLGPGGVRLVNPGSVGMPFDGDPRASWAILHDDGRIEHRRVAYDHAAAAEAVRALGGSWSNVVARRIELAQFVS
jgi:diadenosine tetraphosphatase ApaH/serine/threonine PP2A family protein phosphatase